MVTVDASREWSQSYKNRFDAKNYAEVIKGAAKKEPKENIIADISEREGPGYKHISDSIPKKSFLYTSIWSNFFRQASIWFFPPYVKTITNSNTSPACHCHSN